MTVSKDPVNKANKRIRRESVRYKIGEISFEEYKRRVASIQEYYEVWLSILTPKHIHSIVQN